MLQMYHAVMRFSLNKGEQAHVSGQGIASQSSPPLPKHQERDRGVIVYTRKGVHSAADSSSNFLAFTSTKGVPATNMSMSS